MTADPDSSDLTGFVDCVVGGVELTRRFYREILARYFRPDERLAEDDLVMALTQAGSASLSAAFAADEPQ